MNGHGWVTPNPDGSKARCGGPAICSACAREKGSAEAAIAATPPAAASVKGGARKCECPEFSSGLRCELAAIWLVQVGTRKADAQFSCARHLSRTCTSLYEAESPRKPALTVTAVPA